MRIGVLGINHKSSELRFRELLTKACQKRLSCEQEMAQKFSSVILATCNRIEIYFSAADLAEAHSALLSVLREEIQEPFEHQLYTYFGADCFTHLALVTAGLDSVILAESEIQRQVKIAYENTSLYYRLPSCMHYLFQKCLKVGKQMRSSFPISRDQVSLPGMMWQISQWVLQEVTEKPILFIGNSEINRKVLFHFKAKGVHQIALCTRSPASARSLQESQKITLLDWSELSSWKQYSLIICGTNASEYLLSAQDLMQEDLGSSKLILDLSVPRTVDPLLARHPQIILLNIEEVGRLMERKQQHKSLEVQHAEEFVRAKASQHVELFQHKRGVSQGVVEEVQATVLAR